MAGTTLSGSYVSLRLYSPGYSNPVTISGTVIGTFPKYTALAGYGIPWTVTNIGTITGDISQSSNGIYLAGGQVTNLATGTITGSAGGVEILGSSGNVANFGTIAASGLPSTPGGWGVSIIQATGSVTNYAGGTITGTEYSVYVDSVVVSTAVVGGTVVNTGDIGSATTLSNVGVRLPEAGFVTNQTGGVIRGYTGIYIGGSAYLAELAGTGTVANAGSIFSGTTVGDAVKLTEGGLVSNQATGVIVGADAGVYIRGSSGTVTNA